MQVSSWGAVLYGVVLTALAAGDSVALILRERRAVVLRAAFAAATAPLIAGVLVREMGGDFIVEAPSAVFPVSLGVTGSAAFAAALAALLLVIGPLRDATRRRIAGAAAICGLAALVVELLLY